jgi:hypothetical protein
MTDDGARSLSDAKDKAAQRHWGPKRGFFSATSFALTATSFALLFAATSFALTAFRPQLSDPAATQHSVFCDFFAVYAAPASAGQRPHTVTRHGLRMQDTPCALKIEA